MVTFPTLTQRDNGRERPAMTLVELVAVIAIIGILVAMVLPAIQRARQAALRAECKDHLRQIGLALHGYHGSRNTLPPGMSYKNGKDPFLFMGWPARVLPFLERVDLWSQAETAYGTARFFLMDPHPVDIVVPAFNCPGDPRVSTSYNLPDSPYWVAFTSYLGVEGRNQHVHDGTLFVDSHVRFSSITDGLSNTLLVGERPPSANRRFGWWYAGIGQNNDGSADMILGVEEQNILTVTAGSCPPGTYKFAPGSFNNQCDMFHFWSPHSGGAHFLFADGSVRFLDYSTATLMPALASRAGGEPVSPP